MRPIPQKRGKEGSHYEAEYPLLVVDDACERAKTTEQSSAPQPAGVIERTIQETVEGIKGLEKISLRV